MRPTLGMLACLAATSMAVTMTGQAADSADRQPGLDTATLQLPDSAELTSPVLARGVIENLDPEDDAAVVALAWPRQETLEAMKVGTTFNLLPIARATVAHDGSYALRVNPSDLPAAYRSENHTIDITISAVTPDEGGEEMRTLAIHDGRFVDPLSVGSETVPADPADVLVTIDHAIAPATDGTVKPWTSCSNTLLQRGVYRKSKVAEGLPGTNQKHKFTFKNSQSVTTGVAIDMSNDSAGWKSGGEVTRSKSFEWDSLTHGDRRYYQLEHELGKYKQVCYMEPDHYYMYTKYTWLSIRMTGGTGAPTTTYAPAWAECRGVAGGWWWRSSGSGKAYYNSVGFDISGLVGFDMHSKQQWDSAGKLGYYTPANTGFQLCGNNDVPLYASRVRGKKL